LIDRALIAMHGRHHALQHRIEELPGLFGIAVGQEFHGALEVRKQHGDLFALTFEGTAGSENFLGKIRRRVGQRRAFLVWHGREARGSSGGSASPDQHLALLVPGDLVHLNDFLLEDLQQVIV
jgi:hypothetical protein